MDQNKNPFNLPRLNDEEENNTPNVVPTNDIPTPSPEKPIIEIPQEYYDKLDEEKRIKEEQEQQAQIAKQEQAAFKQESSKVFTLAAFNAAIFFLCLFLMTKKIELALFVIPIAIVVLSITHALKEGKESSYPTSVLIGGMIVAVITFIVSMINDKQADLWFHLAICGAITAFLGLIISSIITKLIARKNEIQALETIGYFIFFAALIGVPFFFYSKYPEEFHRLVFQSITEVKAESEEEFVVKTLKNRYNLNFTCENEVKNHIDFGNRKTKSRICQDPNKNKIEVTSYAYNEGNNQFVVFENYIDVLFLNKLSENISTNIIKTTGVTSAQVYFLPEKGCTFVGNCAESDEYRERIKEEEDINNQYKTSSTLDLSKYMNNYDGLKFVNEYKFKIIIKVTGNYADNGSSDQYIDTVDKIVSLLNSLGLQNNYGFDILVQRDLGSDLIKEELKVTGTTNSDKVFKDYKVVKDANS